MTPTTSDAFYQEVGARIRGARTEASINQETLAVQLGLTRASIINLEKGRHRPSLFMLFEIANVLMCDFMELVPANPPQKAIAYKLNVDFSKSVSSDPLSSNLRGQ